MQFLDLTLDTPAANLALDEALLFAAESNSSPAVDSPTLARSLSETALRRAREQAGSPSIDAPPQAAVEPAQSASASPPVGETLRLWEPREFMVVLGSSSRLLDEVNLATCRERRIEVLRRSSGGAAILAGPGSLMYALVLDRRSRPELSGVDTTHRWVLETLASAIGQIVPGVARRGISDLAVRERKFSGNSLRVRRDWLLYHGTLLYGFPLRSLDACLGTPPRQPAYRAGRRHSHFVINLPLDAKRLREAVCSAFDCSGMATTWPQELTARLAAEKFGNPDWTNRL
ncbi:MAG TPA: hypothetical protein VHX65_16570 [Pirellulales bacterium]|jgi:lipoate-protein ligase A|nr:hypothetical protein [Pirellulales bacterium]